MGSDPQALQVRRLIAVMDRLRSPGGCPWDAEQSHESLVPYLIEECHELAEAIESGDRAHMREELGDVLLQVVFHARVAEESSDPFDIDDVASDIADKLVRRHPHVFGSESAPDSATVEANWERIKAAEKGRESVLDGIPAGLPALAAVAKTTSRADKERLGAVLDEFTRATGPQSGSEAAAPDLDSEEDVGLILLRLAVQAQRAGLDPERALRGALRGMQEQVRIAEAADGVPL